MNKSGGVRQLLLLVGAASGKSETVMWRVCRLCGVSTATMTSSHNLLFGGEPGGEKQGLIEYTYTHIQHQTSTQTHNAWRVQPQCEISITSCHNCDYWSKVRHATCYI